MRPKVLEPYTEQDVMEWNASLAKCEAAIGQCQLAIQAGFPCEQDMQACQAVRDQLTKMKQVYAPGYP